MTSSTDGTTAARSIDFKQVRDKYDVIVIGAGPAGCVAAVAFALRSASVLLVEARPSAASRFAGEWIHPTGVEILKKYELLPRTICAEQPPGKGFVVFPHDGGAAICLDYAEGDVALACEHEALVRHLRTRASSMPNVDYLENARAALLDASYVELKNSDGQLRLVLGDRVVCASGRSTSAQHFGFGKTAPMRSLSRMAGIEISDVKLPFEGYGHIMSGGPGPILGYRIAPNSVRLCLDIPGQYPNGPDQIPWLREAFSRALPESLRAPFARALQTRPVRWAANQFRPRLYYGHDAVGLVGDAVGCFHPLTAAGLTNAFLDVEALVGARNVRDYARQRQRTSYIPELLSNVLYQVIVRTDFSATSIRNAMFSCWRRSVQQRVRTMALLDGRDTQRARFAQSFARVASLAVWRVLSSNPEQTLSLGEWLKWLGASFSLRSAHQRLRFVEWMAPEGLRRHADPAQPIDLPLDYAPASTPNEEYRHAI